MKLDANLKVAKKGTDAVIDRFSLGALAGIEVALNDIKAKGFDNFRYRDRITITCTGISKGDESMGMSDSPDFKIDVERD